MGAKGRFSGKIYCKLIGKLKVVPILLIETLACFSFSAKEGKLRLESLALTILLFLLNF